MADQRFIVRLQIFRQRFYQPFLCQLFYFAIGPAHDRAEILDRRRHITGKHFTGIVIQRQQDSPAGIHRAAIRVVSIVQQAEMIGNHRRLQRMLLHVFFDGIAHQAPAADKFHAR